MCKTFWNDGNQNIIKQQSDGIGNFHFKKISSNERIANMNLKIDDMSNVFENAMDNWGKTRYSNTTNFNELQLEKQQMMNKDDFKDESEELCKIKSK